MINTKHFTAVAMTAFIFGGLTACQTAENKNSATNKAATNVNAAINAATPAPSTSSNASGTPSDAYKAAYAARKNKDIDALKKIMSKDVLEFLTMIGGADEKKKKSLDDMLRELCDQPQAATAEARNEKIDGDKATVEYLDDEGQWRPMDFVKEDGAWKLTIDKADKDSPDDKKDSKPEEKKDKK